MKVERFLLIKIYQNLSKFEKQQGIKAEKTISAEHICYHFKTPQIYQNRTPHRRFIYIFVLYHHKDYYRTPDFRLYLSSIVNYPTTKSNNFIRIYGN